MLPVGPLSRLIASDRFADIARVAVAMLGVAAFCYISGQKTAIVSLMLGIIACALAETDDSGVRRLVSLAVTLVCFAGTSVIVEILAGYPPLFALGLVSSTFALVMLGAASARWGAVATATLILAVYTMIGTEQFSARHDMVSLPLYLTCGAAWYGLLSFVWGLIAPQNAVRFALAAAFDRLAHQFDCVAALFAPYSDTDYEAARLRLAQANSAVVAAMNEVRRTLLDRVGRTRRNGDTEEKLRLYFVAQDIHERIHSSHYPHEALATTFYHSDVLFRAAHLLRTQGSALSSLSAALRRREPTPDMSHARGALTDLRDAMHVSYGLAPRSTHLIEAVRAFMRNMSALQDVLEHPSKADIAGQVLQNPDATTLRQAVIRIWSNMTPQSAHFRHAVRLSLGLLVGYLFLRLMHLPHGFWILLTTLFVCQTSYGATRRRLMERVLGTVVGLLLGWMALQLLPDHTWQLPLIVAAGAGFFAFRRREYPAATAMITLFVVLCFEQVLSGYAVLLPRLFDTLVGVLIAFLVLRLVLPDWRQRRFRDRMADVLEADRRYLQVIAEQYCHGRADDLTYRIARRDAHNAHAALDAVIHDMLKEPHHSAERTDDALRALGFTHQLLSCLSALGAHRNGGVLMNVGDDLYGAGDKLVRVMDALAMQFRQPRNPDAAPFVGFSVPVGGEDDGERRMIRGQYGRIARLCTALGYLLSELTQI